MPVELLQGLAGILPQSELLLHSVAGRVLLALVAAPVNGLDVAYHAFEVNDDE